MEQTVATTQEAVKSRIHDFIVENFLFGSDDPMLTGDASFLESGIIDSTGILELISFVEETFGIHIEDGEMLPENLDSLERVSAFVLRKRNAGEDAPRVGRVQESA